MMCELDEKSHDATFKVIMLCAADLNGKVAMMFEMSNRMPSASCLLNGE